MRTLVILRGSPASGKSTWVKNMGLEDYTLSADNIRMLVQSPILVPDKIHRVISQENDSYVWQLLFELLEKRMEKGEFVIIDATHSRQSDFSRYNNLCKRYRYRRYYVDFSDVTIEECKRRNSLREPHKQVPETIIDKMYARLRTQPKTSGWIEVDKNHFWEQIGMKLFNMNQYNKIHIFGDIHGCYEPLKEYFDKYEFSENEMYIFCGDYIDRGNQNVEVLLTLIELSKHSNVLLLEGNHEIWLNYYALDEYENIKSKRFLNETAIQIKDIDKKDIRAFYRKIGQIAYFEYNGAEYLVSHGGINILPKELQLVATSQFINGVGDYNTNIDEVFAENDMYVDNFIVQVHGHRNTFEIDNIQNISYNLEGKVEFGGYLKVLQLEKGFDPTMIKIKNNNYQPPQEVNEFQECKTNIEIPIFEQLRMSKDVKETELGNNISSFNFTRKAFHKKNWNDITIKARGLFMNTETSDVVARGYEKFFNINETRETSLEHLLTKFRDKHITCYKKENGFLGILSYYNGELHFHSKSTDKGDYARWFKNIFIDNISVLKLVQLEEYLQKNNVSMVFEVIDTINDPHIIKYDKPKLVLLDIIQNTIEFVRLPYDQLQNMASKINCECKSIYKEFDDVREFHKWYLEVTDEDNMEHENIEGVVIECDDFMTKLKFPYYNFWKFMRSVKEGYLKRHTLKLSRLHNAESNYFYAWLKEQDDETLEKDIITLRDMYYMNITDNFANKIRKEKEIENRNTK